VERRVSNHLLGRQILAAIESLCADLDGAIRDPDKLTRIEQPLGHCRSCYSRNQLESLLTHRLKASAESSAPAALRDRLRCNPFPISGISCP